MEYNLLDEKWIIAVDADGRFVEMGIKEVFARAHQVKRLSGEIPTQDLAVLRLLIAIVYAVYQRHDADGTESVIEDEDGARERWAAIWSKGRFDEGVIFDYLERYRDRFYLFHPTRPFYQAPINKGTGYGAAKLNGELSESSNKPRLFTLVSGDRKEALTYAEAARWLINMNAFDDTSSKPTVRGGNLPSTGAGWVGKLGPVYIEGSNLFETIVLNTVMLSEDDEPFPVGIPTWEPEEPRTEERVCIDPPRSPVEIMTLQSRRLLLKRDGRGVTEVLLLGGDIVDKENMFVEQMTLWRRNKEGDFVPRRHDPSRSMWRDFQSILVSSFSDGSEREAGVIRWMRYLVRNGLVPFGSVTVAVAGVKYADKDFYVQDYVSDSLTVNRELFSSMGADWNVRISEAVDTTDKCVYALGRYASNVSQVCGCDENVCNSAAGKARASAYASLDLPFRRWLSSLDPDKDDLEGRMGEWIDSVKGTLRRLAKDILRDSGDRAKVGKDGESAFTAYRKFEGALYKITDGVRE